MITTMCWILWIPTSGTACDEPVVHDAANAETSTALRTESSETPHPRTRRSSSRTPASTSREWAGVREAAHAGNTNYYTRVLDRSDRPRTAPRVPGVTICGTETVLRALERCSGSRPESER